MKSSIKIKPGGHGSGCGADYYGLDGKKRHFRRENTDCTNKDSKACALERGNAGSGPGQNIVLEELLKLLADMSQVDI